LQFVTCALGVSGPAAVLAQAPAPAPSPAAPAATTTGSGGIASEAEDTYPVSATLGVGYRLNHANFVDTEAEAANFGTQRLSFTADAGYDFTDSISASVSFGVDKELSSTYDRPGLGGGLAGGGGSTHVRRATELRDVGIGVSWSDFYTIPVADIGLSASLDGQLPASKASRSAGYLFGLSPGLTLAWSLGSFSSSLGLSYSRFFAEEATQKIDCDRFPDQCRIGGNDLGVPLGLHDASGQLKIGYKFFGKLSTSVSYTLGNSWGAVEFADDEFTTDIAQSGLQAGTGYHSTSVSASYKLFDKTSIGVSMGTSRAFYKADGSGVTMPLFDVDSDLHHRTSYGVSISQGL
jgi:hypothetical protein